MSENTPAKSPAPVFYTRDTEQYKGTRVALLANTKTPEEGKKQEQFYGDLGSVKVKLWEAPGPRGPFFNVKMNDAEGHLVQVGTANAFINQNGYNALSISLKFDTEAAANEAKTKMGLKETIKPYSKDGAAPSYFVNVYSDVSKFAIEANPDEFKRLGFKTEFEAKPKTAKP